MSELEQDNRTLSERLQDNYRLTVVDAETLQEVRSYNVTPLKIYLATIAFVALVALAIFALIFFTPARRLVPGYGDIKENRAYLELSDEVQNLKEELEIQQTYTQGLMNMLAGGKPSEIPSIASTPAAEQSSDSISPNIVQANTVTRSLDRLVLIPPVRGSISAGYNLETGHRGVDILAPKASPVVAISDGIVLTSDWTLETGNTITILHEDYLVSVYKHNSALLKDVGTYVKTGEAIAIIGNSGTLSDGPHLHLEIWYQGQSIDPTQILSFE